MILKVAIPTLKHHIDVRNANADISVRQSINRWIGKLTRSFAVWQVVKQQKMKASLVQNQVMSPQERRAVCFVGILWFLSLKKMQLTT